MSFATPTAFQNLGALIFSNHALDLQQELIFRRLSHLPIEKNDLDSRSCKLIK